MISSEKRKNIVKGYEKFLEWRSQNPEALPSEYYVVKVVRGLERGTPQNALGRHLDFAGLVAFQRYGLQILDDMKNIGLQPHHKLLDYGCGALRAGLILMQYLNPGCYWGLDITDDFIKIGLEDSDPVLIAEKKPFLGIINENNLESVRSAGMNYILASSVLCHVHHKELPLFFDRIMSLMSADTKLRIDCMATDSPMMVKSTQWAYPEKIIEELVNERGGELTVHSTRPLEIEGFDVRFRGNVYLITR